MLAYYNEIDPFPAEWLGNLIEADQIAFGRVDCRSIADVTPADVQYATQAHYFAGVGVWSYALRLAGWGDDRPVWTGSCPCQPFSVAGKGKGTDDVRHLWPVWRDLIEKCRPTTIFGEQVASPIGRDWLAAVRFDLEALGYVVGAADLCAAGAGAPHKRQRLFFGARLGHADGKSTGRYTGASARAQSESESESGGAPARNVGDVPGSSGARLADADGIGRVERPTPRLHGEGQRGDNPTRRGEPTDQFSDCELYRGGDGKHRPVKPGVHPLAHGTPTRVGRLRAYGNAIVPQIAAQFITAFVEATEL